MRKGLECKKRSAAVAGNFSNSKGRTCPSWTGFYPGWASALLVGLALEQTWFLGRTVQHRVLRWHVSPCSGVASVSQSSVPVISPLSSVSWSWVLKEIHPFHLSRLLAICLPSLYKGECCLFCLLWWCHCLILWPMAVPDHWCWGHDKWAISQALEFSMLGDTIRRIDSFLHFLSDSEQVVGCGIILCVP